MWPGYALRSLGLFLCVAALLFALGGLVQINPIWQWGPYAPYLGTNGAQPDWYLGWLIGALRLMPHFDVVIGGYTLIPNRFWGGVLFLALVFGFLYGWPAIERRLERDHAQHNLLDRPRDNPRRTAVGGAVFAWVATIFFAGAADRAFVQFGVPYEGQLWGYRAASILVPIATYFLTRWVCERLREDEGHPGRGSGARAVARNREGGFEELSAERAGVAEADRG